MVRVLGPVALLACLTASGAAREGEVLGPPVPTQQVVVLAAAAGAPETGTVDGPVAMTPVGDADAPVLGLLDCIEEALLHNPDIGVSRDAIRQARAERLAANGAVLPPVSFGYSEIWQQQNKIQLAASAGQPAREIITTPGDTRIFSLNSDWVIFAGGALRANQAIARISQVAAQHQLRSTMNTVIGNTVNAYLQLLRAAELQQVAARSVDLAREQLNVAQASFDADAVPKVHVLRAQAALQNALQGQLKADNALELAKAQLNEAMGRSQLEPLRIAPVPRQLADPPDLLDSLKLAVVQRPELRAQQKLIDINAEGVRAARAGYYPTLMLNSKVSRTMGVSGFSSSDNFQVLLGFQLSLWDWFITDGKVRSASAQVSAARRRLEQTMHTVELQVRQTVLNIGEARKRVEVAQAEVDAARQALDIEQLRYTAGEGIMLELLDARRAYTEAEANLVGAYYDNALAEAAWLAATGSYVQTTETGDMVLRVREQELPVPREHLSSGKSLDELFVDYGVTETAPPH